MRRSFTPLFPLAAMLVALLVSSCGDQSSPEACRHQTTMDLDAGNYDAVLQSSCATPMQLGAAWFGKAGYNVTSVINRLIDANTTTTQTDLNLYLTSLTGVVTDSTLRSLDNSSARFQLVGPSSDLYRDAQFSLAIVEVVKAASIIKAVMDLTGSGTLSSCDINVNGVVDEADATSCALLVSATSTTDPVIGACLVSGVTATWNATADITFPGRAGTYRAMTIDIGTAASSCPGSYDRLLYLNGDANYYLATTAGTCQADDLNIWPCPVTSNIDFVQSLEDSLIASVSAVSTALSGAVGSDVAQSITNFQSQACGGDTTCDAAEIAAYLQNQL